MLVNIEQLVIKVFVLLSFVLLFIWKTPVRLRWPSVVSKMSYSLPNCCHSRVQCDRCVNRRSCCIPRKTYRRCCPGVGIEPWAKTWRRRTAHSDK